MSEASYTVEVAMVIHLRRDHGWTWRRLHSLFPYRSKHFWDTVRAYVKEERKP